MGVANDAARWDSQRASPGHQPRRRHRHVTHKQIIIKARAEVTPLEKVLLIGCARLWAATATSGTQGACVISADQAPRRARSMGARGGDIFNGVTQFSSRFCLNCVS